MKKGNKIYLAYGSNLSIEQMAFRCPYAVPLGVTEVLDYGLFFRGVKGCAVATIEPNTVSTVPVLLWEITPRCEEALDRYEGFPFLYRKEVLTVSVDGKEIDAMVYIMNKGELSSPSERYLKIIYDSYKKLLFDLDILEKALLESCSLDLLCYDLE